MPSTVAFAPPTQPPAAAESRRQAAPEAGEFKPFGADGLTFGDILDVLNPLQHLPIIGSIYRAITGDTISAASRVAGGALFGGLIGFAAAVADTVIEESSGKDAGAHVMALLRDARSQPGGSREPPWSETASLRHDANEHDDGWWQDPDTPATTKNVAANGNANMAARGAPARGGEFQVAQAASLRHDANEHDDGWWQDPDTAAGTKNAAANGNDDMAARGDPARGGEFQAAQAASLRHDANEHDDGWWQDPDTPATTKNAAANGNADMAARGDPARRGEFQAAQAASLRHDANEHDDGWWQDPDSATDTKNVAAVNYLVGPGAALNGGPRALGAALPPPASLAANSAMVTALRNGESRYFRPGGTINTDAWLKLMSNVSANRGPYAAPTGAAGLASATLAKALATYGAAQAIAAQAGKGSARP